MDKIRWGKVKVGSTLLPKIGLQKYKENIFLIKKLETNLYFFKSVIVKMPLQYETQIVRDKLKQIRLNTANSLTDNIRNFYAA